MSDTDDFIDIAIEVSDKVPTKPNFGMGMLLGYHTAWLDRYVTEYAEAADMLDDGFTVNDDLYKRATIWKSQNPAPPTFKVGRLASPYTQIVDLLPTTAQEGFIYRGTVNGTAITREVPASSSIAAEATALELLVEAVTGISSTTTSTTITATSTAGQLFQHSWARGMKVIDQTVDAGFNANMALIFDEDPNFYGFTLGPSSEAYTLLAAAWAEANKRIFFPQSSDWDVIDGAQSTDVATLLKALAYTRTAGIWHRAIAGTEWAADAFMSSFLGRDPGAATPAFKTLAGITADDLRTGEMTALGTKNFTRYKAQGGANITFEGKTPSGRFIDVTRNVDWIDAEARANIYGVFLNNPVVPYSDLGISLIKGAVAQALKTGQEMGIIAIDPAPVVTVPALADTTSADRAARILRNVRFTARLNGAIHRTIVRGNISV